MKAYREEEVQAYPFLTSACYLREGTPIPSGGRVGPRGGLDILDERKVSLRHFKKQHSFTEAFFCHNN
jgi:hypothetical protein